MGGLYCAATRVAQRGLCCIYWPLWANKAEASLGHAGGPPLCCRLAAAPPDGVVAEFANQSQLDGPNLGVTESESLASRGPKSDITESCQ